MTIVAEFSIPPDALPGGSALESLPRVRIELERIVPTDDSVLPYFWVFGTDIDDFLSRVETDPDLAELRVLTEREDIALFEAKWQPEAPIIRGIKRLRATIMEATGTADGWQFRVRATSRDRLADFQETFRDEGIPVELDRIYNLAEIVETERPLTPDQRETLLAAYHEGYFDDPRRATQDDLADRFGVSRRAVSNRLRRGTHNLVGSVLVESGEDER